MFLATYQDLQHTKQQENPQLKAAGFEIGDYLEIECDGDKITLIKTTPPEPKATQKSLEEKIKNLDKAQREKLARVIDKL